MIARTVRVTGRMARADVVLSDQPQRGDGGAGDAAIAMGYRIGVAMPTALGGLAILSVVYIFVPAAIAAGRALL